MIYTKFLTLPLSSQINYTLTNFADHSQHYSHDRLNRYLRNDKLRPRLVWEQVKDSIVTSPDGYLYATRASMLHIERCGKLFYCPLKDNRQVDEGDGTAITYQRVDSLSWSETEQLAGKSVHVKDFPKGHRLQLFRLVVSPDRTDYVVTNDQTQHSTDDVQKACAIRWKIEQLHREAKQVTGLERCQCRKARIQRNHIACALLVWCRLKELAYETERTVYQIKHGQLSDYLIQQLKNPFVLMVLA